MDLLFKVFSNNPIQPAKIPYPTAVAKIAGSYAIMAVGCDDNLKIKNTCLKIKNTCLGTAETNGAPLTCNSWGTGWGDGGYGWLPYDYIKNGLAVDWWSLIKQEWIDTKAFKI